MKRRITLERTFDAPIEDVWELWTTKDGIEQWWGPEGFSVTVVSIDLRPGGRLQYDMTAVQPEMVAYMQREGMPTTTRSTVTYTEVIAPKRLAYVHAMDFVPGVVPYDVATEIDLLRVPDGVRMVMRFDAMHDETWTQRAVMGWESELRRLEKLLRSRK